MTTIKRVALAGASGNLGPAILHALLSANFDVTVLTRKESASTFPKASNLTVVAVDYASTESLKSALLGHDALVSTLASLALPVQLSLFDAAAAAGVRRVIPSEFGVDTTTSPTKELPVFGHKVQVQEHLAALAAKDSNFSYTLILNSAFFDWGLEVGFVVYVKGRTADLYDGGDRPFSVTRLPVVGKAVVGVLQHPEETKNRAVKVHEAVVTQNQLVSIAEKLSGDKFTTTAWDTKEHEMLGYEALKKGDYSVMNDFIRRAIWGEGYGGRFMGVDNELLGVKMLSDSEIEEIVAKCVPRTASIVWRRPFSHSPVKEADFTHAVIGAGAVGLAIARRLAARKGTSTILIERHGSVGTETSSRNSEVIHAGLYYGHDTLKTDLCLKGKHMMYDLCARKGIPHRNTKKWIVAQDEDQMKEIQKVHEFAKSIGVPTRFLSKEEIKKREPDVRAEAGVLESESTGIVNSHAFMAYLEGDFQERGGETAFNTAVTRIETINEGDSGYRIYTEGSDEPIEVEALINSAGLFAITINNMILPEDRHKKPYYAKGSYFSYSSSHPKPKTLLYPAPVPGHGGLGTHLTLDMAGRVRFGPDVEWVDDPTDLSVNDNQLEEAISMIQDYLPGIDANAISLDYCGIRPKLGKTSGTAGPDFADFYIKEEKGFPCFINLLGIESPGLTSSLAIGEVVDHMLYGSESKKHHHDPYDEGQTPALDFHH